MSNIERADRTRRRLRRRCRSACGSSVTPRALRRSFVRRSSAAGDPARSRDRSSPAVHQGRGDHLPWRPAHPNGCCTAYVARRPRLSSGATCRRATDCGTVVKRTGTGQRCLEGYEAVRHLRRGGRPGAGHLVRGPARHARVREVVAIIPALGRGRDRGWLDFVYLPARRPRRML
jgi:hypothetical protein